MKKNFWIGGVVIIILIAGGYFLFNKSRQANGEAIKIGTIFAQSGDAAYWGVDEERAVELAVDDADANGGINGKPIQIVAEDAPAIDSIQKAVSGIQKLINVDHVVAVLGPTWDDNAQAVAPLADRFKTVMISASASASAEQKEDYKFFFSTNLPEQSEIERITQYAQEKGYTKVAVINTSDTFSLLYGDSFAKHGASHRITVAKHIIINDTSPKDFRTYIATLKDAQIDAVYVVLDDEGSKCPFLEQARELGLNKPILSSISTQSPDSLQKCGSVMSQVSYTYQKQGPEYDALIKKYEAKYHAEPSGPAITEAYDAANILITQMRAGNLSGEQLRSGIAAMKNFSGVTGSGMNWDAIGHITLPASDFNIKTVKDGQFVVVE